MTHLKKGLGVGLVLLSIACGGADPQEITRRVRHLRNTDKLDRALPQALDAIEDLSGKDKADIQILAAETAYDLYRRTNNKAYATQALELLQAVMNDKLISDGRPEGLAAAIFKSYEKFDRAVKYYRLAEKYAAPTDPVRAAAYAYQVIDIVKGRNSHQVIISETESFLRKYPNHPQVSAIQQINLSSKQADESEWQHTKAQAEDDEY